MSGPSPDHRTDEQLVAAANRGEAAAFDALYQRYREWVIGLAWRWTGDREAALDVAQEVFLYLLRRFPGFELRARMTTFLYPAVKHTAMEMVRKRRREMPDPVAAAEAAERAEGGDGGGSAERGRRELAEAMRGLSEEHREVVLMRFVDGFSLGEIADVLGVPVGTVKSRLHHALSRLRADEGVREFFFGR